MWDVGQFNRRSGSDRVTGRYGMSPGWSPQHSTVFRSHPVDHPIQLWRVDEAKRTTSESPTQHSRPVDAGTSIHDLYERIQFGAAHLIVVS